MTLWADKTRDRPDRLGWAIAFACIMTALLAACTSASPPPDPRRDEPICQVALRDVAAMWDPSRAGGAGYGTVSSFAGEPSLYFSSWSVRLAAAARIDLPELDRTALGGWLTAVLEDPEPVVQREGLSSVAVTELAVEGRRVLGLPAMPKLVAPVLERLRVGGQYRDRPSGQPAWWSTYVAVSAAERSGATVPDEVHGAARAALTNALEATDVNSIVETGIPVVGTVVLLEPNRTADAIDRGLAARLRDWRERLLAQGPSAVTVGAVKSLRDIGARVGVALDGVPAPLVAALTAASGYLTLQPHGEHGDPQATFNAISLGAPVSAGLSNALRTGLVPQGWLHPITSATVETTYRAFAVARLCDPGFLPEALRPAIRTWLDQAVDQWLHGGSGAASSGGSRGGGAVGGSGGGGEAAAAPGAGRALIDLRSACALAKAYHVDIAEVERDAVGRGLANVLNAGGGGIASVATALTAATDCGLSLPKDSLTAIRTSLATQRPSSAADAAGMAMIGSILEAPELIEIARRTVAPLRTGDVFRYSPEAEFADLMSTQVGYSLAPPSEPGARQRAVARFWTPDGTAFVDAQAPAGSASTGPAATARRPVVDLVSLLAGISLAIGSSEPMVLP